MSESRYFSSLFFKFIERLAVKLIGLVVSIILARLIDPNDFGMIAIITVFINLSYAFIEGGFTSALIQRKDPDALDYSTVFFISVCVSVILIVCLYFFAPSIAGFYHSEGIVQPLRFYSISLLFSAVNSVQVAHLQKEMKFKLLLKCNLISSLSSGIVGIILALKGYGIWALIGYYFMTVLLSSVLMIVNERWFPGMFFSFSRARILFSYGWKMLVSSLLCSFYNDVRSLVIGRKYSPTELAFYNRGQQFPDTIANTFDNSIQAVMFPALASVQDSKKRFTDLLEKSMALSCGLVMPSIAGLFIVSSQFVRVFLTDTWDPCVPYMKWVCVAELSIPFVSSLLAALKAIGRSDIYLKLELQRRSSMLVILMIGLSFHSIFAIAASFAIGSWIDFLIVALNASSILGIGIKKILQCTRKTFLATIIMVISIYPLSFFSGLVSDVCVLFLQILLGVLIYVLMCFLLKTELFVLVKDYVMNSKTKGV